MAAIQTTNATFQINNAKLDVPVFALFINDNINFLENIKQRFRRTNSWNKYRSKTTTEAKNNNLDYLIDSTFRNFNRLFVLWFQNGNDYPMRDSFNKYNMQLIEIKGFNALIDNKPFFDQPVKSNQEAYEKLTEMSKADNYTTENLLCYLHHQKYYKLIGIDWSRQTNTSISQKKNNNLVGKSEEDDDDDDDATVFFIADKQQKTILNFSSNSLIVTE